MHYNPQHIKYKATLSADLITVDVLFILQTHTGRSFGYAGEFVHREYRLLSSAVPARTSSGCYVLGHATGAKDVKLPLEDYVRFKAAVVAFNNEFA